MEKAGRRARSDACLWHLVRRPSLFFVVTLVCAGCLYAPLVPTSRVMREVTDADIATPPDEARIVVVRPSWFGPNVTLRLFDEDGRFLADVVAHTHATFAVRPGDHVWTMLAREIDLEPTGRRAVFAQVGAGRVYFTQIFWELGEGPFFESITPRSSDWIHVRAWMASTTSLAPDDDAFGRPVVGGLERLDVTRTRAAELSVEEREAYTLRVEDGPRWRRRDE
jgi:hypothetical protein